MFGCVCPDFVRKGPVCGSGREADSEVDHGFGARYTVLVPANKPSQQCWRPAAPRHCYNSPRPPKIQTHSGRQNQRGWHGDCAAADRPDHCQSQVMMTNVRLVIKAMTYSNDCLNGF